MRKFLFLALFPLSVLICGAQTPGFDGDEPATVPEPGAEEGPRPFGAQALLIIDADTVKDIWIIAATKGEIRYREAPVSIDTFDMRIAKAKSIYLIEPKEFAQAMDLYQARKYDEAKKKFAAVKLRYKSMEAMPGNHSALAAFYELECMRRLGDLEGLSTGMQRFIKDPLTRESQQRQVDLYVFWDAVRTKSWQRIDALAKERVNEHLPNFLRAQIGYCQGLALEGLKKPTAALNAYNTAITADSGASEEITRQAALNIMRIHKANPDVQLAMKLWGTPDQNKNTQGYFRLLEASSMAKFYQFLLGGGSALPPEYKDLLNYQEGGAKTAAAPAPAVEKAEKKTDKKPADGEKAADDEKAADADDEK